MGKNTFIMIDCHFASLFSVFPCSEDTKMTWLISSRCFWSLKFSEWCFCGWCLSVWSMKHTVRVTLELSALSEHECFRRFKWNLKGVFTLDKCKPSAYPSSPMVPPGKMWLLNCDVISSWPFSLLNNSIRACRQLCPFLQISHYFSSIHLSIISFLNH